VLIILPLGRLLVLLVAYQTKITSLLWYEQTNEKSSQMTEL